jgi:hypothetical protein
VVSGEYCDESGSSASSCLYQARYNEASNRAFHFCAKTMKNRPHPSNSPQDRALAHVAALSWGRPMDAPVRVTLNFHPDWTQEKYQPFRHWPLTAYTDLNSKLVPATVD